MLIGAFDASLLKNLLAGKKKINHRPNSSNIPGWGIIETDSGTIRAEQDFFNDFLSFKWFPNAKVLLKWCLFKN